MTLKGLGQFHSPGEMTSEVRYFLLTSIGMGREGTKGLGQRMTGYQNPCTANPLAAGKTKSRLTCCWDGGHVYWV